MNIIETDFVKLEFEEIDHNQLSEIIHAIGALIVRGEIPQQGVVVGQTSQSEVKYDCNGPSWSHSQWVVEYKTQVKVTFKKAVSLSKIKEQFCFGWLYAGFKNYSARCGGTVSVTLNGRRVTKVGGFAGMQDFKFADA